MSGNVPLSRVEQRQDALNNLFELSNILNTGLDRESIEIITELCELGVNPEALSAAIKEIRREADSNVKEPKKVNE